MHARRANNIEEATHRYPTSVLFGAGYFGDGMKYLVASSTKAALEAARSADITFEQMQY